MLIHHLRDDLLQTALLVDYDAGRVQDFLEDPDVSVLFEEHRVECLLQKALKDCSAWLLIEVLH